MEQEQMNKLDTYMNIFLETTFFFFLICSAWMGLEKYFYGEIQNRVVDNIIAIPMYISLWFNIKHFYFKLNK